MFALVAFGHTTNPVLHVDTARFSFSSPLRSSPLLLYLRCALSAPVRPALPCIRAHPTFLPFETFHASKSRPMIVFFFSWTYPSFSLNLCFASEYRSRDTQPQAPIQHLLLSSTSRVYLHYAILFDAEALSVLSSLFSSSPLVSYALFILPRARRHRRTHIFHNTMLTAHSATFFWLPGTKTTTVPF
jgi:hypothetical protein